ncbi:MAG: biotin--[acetyl-CoA-carboxylase] ligase, partial [Acidimicrobiales bacterium]
MLDAGARSRLAATRFADLRWFDTVDSTNAWLLARAREGAPEGLVAVADHQGSGRGRLGRSWCSPPGASLLVSVLLRPLLDAEHLYLATAVVALAASDACRRETGVSPELKWPNDLTLGGGKLAGILAEADVGASGIRAVVVGLGLNANWPPGAEDPALPPGAVALNQAVGFDVDRGRLLVAMLESLE